MSECIPLHLRTKKLGFWDLKPKGYEHLTAEQAKSTGMFLLPSHLLTGTGSINSTPLVLEPAQTRSIGRNTRTLYIGGLPDNVTEEQIVKFFNEAYEERGLDKPPGNPCLGCTLSENKNSCHLEFRSKDEATEALALEGVEFEFKPLKVRRPRDYVAGEDDPHYTPGVISNIVQDSMFKIFIGGLPPFVTDSQVIELLQTFGELKSFHLVKDAATGLSRGFAFCEYLKPEITDMACEGLHGIEMGEKKLIVQRASAGGSVLPAVDGALPGAGVGRPILPIEILGANGLKPPVPTKVLLLLNTVKPEDIAEDHDYDEIFDDIKKECEKFGEVTKLVMPRPNIDEDIYVPGLKKVFVQYAQKHHASTAQLSLAGRKFNGNTVLTTFYDEQKFEAGILV